MRQLSIIFLSLLLLYSCNEATDTPSFNDGTGGQDNINPNPLPTPDNPDPTPTPLPTVEIKKFNFFASDLNPEDTEMAYKDRVKPIQLATPIQDKDCHYKYEDKCIKNRQVLFQFNIDELNKQYPSDLWIVTEFKLRASFYSVSRDISEELLCLLNRKVCSGIEIKKLGGIALPFLWRNSRFWTGPEEKHVPNKHFDKVLRSSINTDGVAISLENTFDLISLFGLTSKTLLTTIRKNNGLHFSVSSDTYVEDPELFITIKRRQLSQ